MYIKRYKSKRRLKRSWIPVYRGCDEGSLMVPEDHYITGYTYRKAYSTRAYVYKEIQSQWKA